ncbi:DUF262 domain-containing protein [Acinetobacter baumannii]|uniref:DUF262 domain-containing protein n=1 Tax=Acinetobacter baumannii TaxID=470 RepID=UPI0029582F0B|nr:DUF262 domain-containing protein [Acinetobacter baumannii]
MNQDIIYKDPTVDFIESLLQDITEGRLLYPKFQRPLIWDTSDKLALLESIRIGTPIGSVLLWKSKTAIPCHTSFEGFALGYPKEGSDNFYILDGLQRLSTLYMALSQIKNHSETGFNVDYYYYDLKGNKFISQDYVDDSPYLLPVNILLNTISLVKFQRKVFEEVDKSEFEEILKKIDSLHAAFKKYKLPVISIVTDNIKAVTSTFHKINSKGVQVNEKDMFHALTWSKSFDLNNEIEILKNKFLSPLKWGDIDDETIFRTIKVNLHLNVYKTSTDAFVKKVVEDNNFLYKSTISLKNAIEFIIGELNVPHISFMPSPIQIPIIAHCFYELKTLSDRQKEILKNWFWYTAYTESFSGLSDDNLKKIIDDLYKSLTLEKYIWSITKKNSCIDKSDKYIFRSVRTKLWLLNILRYNNFHNFENLDKSSIKFLFNKNQLANKTLFQHLGNRGLFNDTDIIFKSDEFFKFSSPDEIIHNRYNKYAEFEKNFFLKLLDLYDGDVLN